MYVVYSNRQHYAFLCRNMCIGEWEKNGAISIRTKENKP